MELPITYDQLRFCVDSAKNSREHKLKDCLLSELMNPIDVLHSLQQDITTSIMRKDKKTFFTCDIAEYKRIYRTFGDSKLVNKEIFTILEPYLKNFPTANREIIVTQQDISGNPISCKVVLQFNLPWSPPTSDQTNSHLPRVSSRDA